MSNTLQSNTRKSQASPSIPNNRALLQYRNGFYQGYINEFNQRQGRGVFLWHTGEMYYGDWAQDRMDGEGIFYFALGGYVYGTFIEDRVNGYAVLCFSNGNYTAGFWERGVLTGKVIQHSKDTNEWCLNEYHDGTPHRTLTKGKDTPPIHTFNMIEVYSLKKLLDKDFNLFGSRSMSNKKNETTHLDFLAIEPNGWYHGNVSSRRPHGLGIVCYSEHKSDRGLFQNGALNGPGRSLFSNGDVYDGFYKDGKFHGAGIYFKNETEQYLYGMYESNECVQALTLGNGYPHELMRTLKADYMLESAEFIDKETDTEILTLLYNDQNPVQEQESIQNFHDDHGNKSLEERYTSRQGERDHEERGGNFLDGVESYRSVKEGQGTDRSHQRVVEYDKNYMVSSEENLSLREQNSGGNKKREHGQKTEAKDKYFSYKISEKDSLKDNSSSNSELKDEPTSKKSLQMSEVLEKKRGSKANTDSRPRLSEKGNGLDNNYWSRGSDNDKDAVVNRRSFQFETGMGTDVHFELRLENTHKDQEKSAVQNDYWNMATKEDARQDNYWANTHKTTANTTYSVPETSVPYVSRASGLIEKVPRDNQVQKEKSSGFGTYASPIEKQYEEMKVDLTTSEYRRPPSSQASSEVKADIMNKDSANTYKYDGNAYSGTSYSNTGNEAFQPNSDLPDGINSQVKKIMDQIFGQRSSTSAANTTTTTTTTTNNNLSPPLALNIQLSTTGYDLIKDSHNLLEAHSVLTTQPVDVSPTFAPLRSEMRESMDSFQNKSRASYNANLENKYYENVEKPATELLSPDWNLKIISSLESSAVCDRPKETGIQPMQSFGLIPNFSEENIPSKSLFAAEHNSNKSNAIVLIPPEEDFTRDRATSGQFGGASQESSSYSQPYSYYVPEVKQEQEVSKSVSYSQPYSYYVPEVKQEQEVSKSVEKPVKDFTYTGDMVISTIHEDADTKSYLKAKEPITKKIEHSSGISDNVTKADSYYPSSSPVSYSNPEFGRTYELTQDRYTENLHKSGVPVQGDVVKNESMAMRTERTDTWSVYTGPKNIDMNMSYAYSERPAEQSTNDILKKYGLKPVGPNQEINSDLDNGSYSNRYGASKNESPEKKLQDISLAFSPIKESKGYGVEEELFKIIQLKLELLLQEQTKTAGAVEDIKRAINDKMENLFREERRESDFFKRMIGDKLDSLFREKTVDLSRDQLVKMHEDLSLHNKQIASSVQEVNNKVDLLLQNQGRLTVDTEQRLTSKIEVLVKEQGQRGSIQNNGTGASSARQSPVKDNISMKIVEGTRKSSKQLDTPNTVRQEVFTYTNHETNNQTRKKSQSETVDEKRLSKTNVSEKAGNQPPQVYKTPQKEVKRGDLSLKIVTSGSSIPMKESHNVEEARSIKCESNSDLKRSHNSKIDQELKTINESRLESRKRGEPDMSELSEDINDYVSVTSEAAPLKVVNSMQTKKSELFMKNEHTINLIQYETQLKESQLSSSIKTPNTNSLEKQYRSNLNPERTPASTPQNKSPIPPRSLTPTPQSRGPLDVSYRNYERSPPPVISHNSSIVTDSQPGTNRRHKSEIYTFKKSPVSSSQKDNLQVSFKRQGTGGSQDPSRKQDQQAGQNGGNSLQGTQLKEKEREQKTLSPINVRESANWHVIPLCGEESSLDESEELIQEERKVQDKNNQGNLTNRSQVSKGPGKEVKKNTGTQSHNRAQSISSQSSYNVLEMKSFHRLSGSKPTEDLAKRGETRDTREQQETDRNNGQIGFNVFDHFVVTSNNNDIPTAEYVRIQKNSAVHRNMAFMRKDFESPNAVKFNSSTKKQSIQSKLPQQEVDLYEEDTEQFGGYGLNRRRNTPKEVSAWRNPEDVPDDYSTGQNEMVYEQFASPMRIRREPVSPYNGPRSAYQEGRLGTVRWRLQIEDMSQEYERSSNTKGNTSRSRFEGDDWGRVDARKYNDNNQFVSNGKIRPVSALNSPINSKGGVDQLIRTVNATGDINVKKNIPGAKKQDNGNQTISRQIFSSGSGSHAKQNFMNDMKVPSLPFAQESAAKRYSDNQFDNFANRPSVLENSSISQKRNSYGFTNFSVPHLDKDMKQN